MILTTIILYSCINIVVIFALFNIEKRLEKALLDSIVILRGRKVENISRKFFKYALNVLHLLAAFEIYFIALPSSMLNYICSAFAIIFIILRLIAIYTLNKYWSFDVEIKYKHRIVDTGIYAIFKHPAYIGNAYIPLTYMAFGASLTSFLSIIFVVAFYLFRASIENRIITKIRTRELYNDCCNEHGKIILLNKDNLADT